MTLLTDADREDIRMRTLLAVGLVSTASPERLRAVIEHIISASVERGKSAGRAEAIAEAARTCRDAHAAAEALAYEPPTYRAGYRTGCWGCATAIEALA